MLQLIMDLIALKSYWVISNGLQAGGNINFAK
jgi:hypothetical protein